MRTTRTRYASSAILILLALGFALRLIIAYRLPGSGFGVDLDAFRYWANDIATHGPYGFYDRPFFHDYTPGYLYVLGLVGLVQRVLPGLDLIKAPAILADLVVGWLAYSITLDLGARHRTALIAAAIVLFNPITWFDSVVWGQVDSVGLVFLLLGLRELLRDRPERSVVWAVVAAITKPQLGILVPIVAAVLLRRYLWNPLRSSGSGDPAPAGWADREHGPVRLLTSAVAGIVAVLAMTIPFGLSIPGLIDQVFKTAGGYPWLTVNAYNPWALLSLDGAGLAATGQWVHDAVASDGGPAFMFGSIPAAYVGAALMILVMVAVAAVVAFRPERRTIMVGLALLAIAFFVVPTRVHERYLYPFFAVSSILAAISWRWRWAVVVLAVANFLNLYVVLTTIYPNNPQIADWLGIGSTIRQTQFVVAIALVHLAGFVWVVLQLRPGAQELLAEELSAAASSPTPTSSRGAQSGPVPGVAGRLDPPVRGQGALDDGGFGPALAGVGSAPWRGVDASAAIPTPLPGPRASGSAFPGPAERFYPELGPFGAIWRRLTARPMRADRSRALHGESGGRLDRLDLWLIVVIVVGALVMRTWRLAEPYQMHFDEVYHARTATEFLQDWRYGLPHQIYEYTHPHLAKYAIAVGIEIWGNDRVTGTSALGSQVRDVAVEPRWDDPSLPSARAGDRLYVATGTEVRVYDLRDRTIVATVPAPGSTTVSVDTVDHRLFVGSDTGSISVIDTRRSFDRLRSGASSAAIGPPTVVGSAGASISHLFATDDGLVVVAITGSGEVVGLDEASGAVLGRQKVAGAADVASVSSATKDAVVAKPGDIADAGAEAAELARILGRPSSDFIPRLTATSDAVVIAGAVDSTVRAALDASIANGKLAGVSIRPVPEVAVATAAGITFLAPADMSVAATLNLPAGATGLAATSGLDAPRLYVASGSTVSVVKVGSQGTANTVEATIQMPGRALRVTYDPATLMVHVLAEAPGAAPAATSGNGGSSPAQGTTIGVALANPTIYVIEPHGNAVYADARLPFSPAAWATDIAPQYPSLDRQSILAFAGDGRTATVDIGHNAFGWRLPGVILGALSGALLYLLARILFRRRSLGVLVAILSLVDGMLFVQSRIAMNDVYVGFFLLLAYTLFAGLWTERWRWRGAFWLIMPVIGLSLGLALASKWVAAYAIGAIGILVLARSALGRLVLIAGLVLGTVALGYIAISVPRGATSGGNLFFMLLMIGLTLAAVVATVLHPVAWSLDEVRFAVGVPAAAGAAIGLAAIPLNLSTPIALGPVSAPPMEIAILLLIGAGLIALLFKLAGDSGLGPLARRPDPADPILLTEPASPAPSGWLRPGWLFGLPIAWTIACLLLIPVAVYVLSYVPWALNADPKIGMDPAIFPAGTPIIGNWPPHHNGTTLWDLTTSMYSYHNDLRATHPASSPWWAWPFDLKPVWFYQGSFAGGTAASIYDAGNLVIWWLGVPAMAFCAWQAFRRRSLGLALITIAFACQWLSWARIDRATFQYHYYTSVPFIILALAYFLAEIWNGPSTRTWLLARLAAGAAIVGPAAMWLFKGPLCGFVRVEAVNKGSLACVSNAGDLVVTTRIALIVVVLVVSAVVLLWQLVHLDDADLASGTRARDPNGPIVRFVLTAIIATGLVFVASAFGGEAVLVKAPQFQQAPFALLGLVVTGFVASFVVTARDPRRFVAGTVFAAIAAFLVFYPNISALPLPSVIVNAYQGLLPTYLYPFQFPVNTDPPTLSPTLFARDPAILLAALVVTCLIVGYSAYVWRISNAEHAEGRFPEEPLASGGG